MSAPTSNCSLTATTVVLMATPNVPSKPTALPGIANVIVPLSRPARPAGVMTKKPSPFWSRTPAGAPASPTNSATLLAAIRTNLGGWAPGLFCACGLSWPVTCSNAKLPVSVWPRTVSVALASTRTECAGMSGVDGLPSWSTGLAVVLILTDTVVERPNAGTLTVAVTTP